MRLKTKATIAILVISLVVFLMLHLVASLVIMPGFKAVDDKESRQSLNQASSSINYRISQLTRAVKDYAWWDDTYYYVENRNLDYTETNFVDSTFENLRLNLIAILDNDHGIVYAKMFDLNDSIANEVDEELQEMLIAGSQSWIFESDDYAFSGLVSVNNEPMMIAGTQILTSLCEGPPVGELVFGTYLDNLEVSSLEGINNIDFSVRTIGDVQESSFELVDLMLAAPEASVVKSSSDAVLSAYVLLNDFDLNPAFVLQVNEPRTAFQQGVWVENIFVACSLSIVAVLTVGTLALLEVGIVRPMKKLTSSLKATAFDFARADSRSKFGTDEVSLLSAAVKDTVDKKLEAMLEVSRMVAHDLRNPLAAIRNANFVLKTNYGSAIGDKGNRMLQKIEECIDYSDKIVRDLLDYSSEIKIEKVEINLKELIGTCLKTISVPSNVKVVNGVSADCIVSVDGRIQRVFTNIMKNAIDAMPKGGELLISCTAIGREVVVELADSGEGMSDETLKKIFTPFFTTKSKGLGIGLSICKRIVEAHGGRLGIKSVLGKGSTFSIHLPA